MDNTKDYFIDDWKFNRIPNNESGYMSDGGRIVAYNTITDELKDKLDAMYDSGSALITNIIKTHCNGQGINLIASVERADTCITVPLVESESIWKSDNDKLSKLVNQVFKCIIDKVDKYSWPPKPDKLYPVYTSGSRYMPDAMVGLINDICVQYDTKYCMYAALLSDNSYDLVCKYYKHIRSVMKDIMKCKNISIDSKTKSLILTDANKGVGPNIDRANALACAVMFIILNIVQLLQLEE